MKEVRICFEIIEVPADTCDFLLPESMELSFEASAKDIDYEVLVQNFNVKEFLEYVGLDGLINPEKVRVISPEEYDKKYGNKA